MPGLCISFSSILYRPVLNFFHFIIKTNIFISLAAVALTLVTQVQLGMEPQIRSYLFIIFFATIFEYNLHHLMAVIKNPQTLNNSKHVWIKKNIRVFITLLLISVVGFISALFFAKKEVLITLFPIALLTLLYSQPVLNLKKNVFRLREIPLIKIFVIALVWTCATILLPIIQDEQFVNKSQLIFMLIERFIFVFAITIPFDIRDMEADKESGLKTIPLMVGEKRSTELAIVALMLFVVICILHYGAGQNYYILTALIISALSTIVAIKSNKLQSKKFYHHFFLDGTMLLQGILVCLFYYLDSRS